MPDLPPRRSPGRSGQRAPYANGEKRRAELVDAAFALFAEQGFQRLSIRQIAEAVGTSHTALVHHFGSKDALLQAVLERREQQQGPWREALVKSRGLLEAVPEVMRKNQKLRGIIQLDATLRAEAMRPDHPAAEFVRRREETFYSLVLAEVLEEQRAGRVRQALDATVVARQITSLIEGIEGRWLYDSTLDMSAHLAAFMDLIREPTPHA